MYEHFLLLSAAVTILSCKHYQHYLPVADTFLKRYIEGFIQIYGIDSISSNVHNLCHVIQDVKKFGPLPGISSYPFETCLGDMKTLIRSGHLPLSQISRRITELSKLHNSGCRNDQGTSIDVTREVRAEIPDLPMCKVFYEQLHLANNFILCNDAKNKYFLKNNGDIVLMKNATYLEDKIHIYGACLRSKYDFFCEPFASSYINIYASKGKMVVSSEGDSKYICNVHNPTLHLINDIKCKLYCLKYYRKFVFFPILHTLDVEIKTQI